MSDTKVVPENINLSQIMEISERDNSAEIELYMSNPELSTKLAVPINNSLQYLKDQAVSIFQDAQIELRYQGIRVGLNKKLVELGISAGDRCRIEVSADPTNFNSLSDPKIEIIKSQEFDALLTNINDPKIQNNTEAIEQVGASIEKCTFNKPFLGGFKHKITGSEYYNASVQTDPPKRMPRLVEVFERITQTVVPKSTSQQTRLDACTQMNSTGYHISECNDKVINGGKYETANERMNRIEKHVLILQTHFRRIRAQQYVKSLKVDKRKRSEWEEKERIGITEMRNAIHNKDLNRRMNPKTKSDFDLLYNALESWRADEIERINSTLFGPDRKAALCALLEQEAQLISCIHRHKREADLQNTETKNMKFMDKSASSKCWISADGKMTEMETPYTQRAAKLRDLYTSLTLANITHEERLDVLLTLKQTVCEHDCQLTRDIVDLLERERNLINRGTGNEALRGLRKRILGLYLQYVETPLFNPEAAKLIRVGQDSSQLSGKVYFCKSCREYLPTTDFSLNTNARSIGHCRQCQDLDNRGRERKDNALYRQMLNKLRKNEERYNDASKVVFLLQEKDIRYLVNTIWDSKSILSGEIELYNLQFERWNISQHWAPWNCVLLTNSEAKIHREVDQVSESYGVTFTNIIKGKHMEAKKYFLNLDSINQYFKHSILLREERIMI